MFWRRGRPIFFNGFLIIDTSFIVLIIGSIIKMLFVVNIKILLITIVIFSIPKILFLNTASLYYSFVLLFFVFNMFRSEKLVRQLDSQSQLNQV